MRWLSLTTSYGYRDISDALRGKMIICILNDSVIRPFSDLRNLCFNLQLRKNRHLSTFKVTHSTFNVLVTYNHYVGDECNERC